MERCKRCSRQLESVDLEWDKVTSEDIDALLQTLPPERSLELRELLTANEGNGTEPVELSRFFSNSFRTDKFSRKSNGEISSGDSQALTREALESTEECVQSRKEAGVGYMRGSLALVLDSNGEQQNARKMQDASGDSDSEKTAGSTAPTLANPAVAGDAALAAPSTGNASNQAESFILLSASQIQPALLETEISRLSSAEGTVEQNQHLSDKGTHDNQSASLPDKTEAASAAGREMTRQRDDITETLGIIGRVADRLEERSVLDHPMCEDCAEIMLRLLDRETSDCMREKQILDGIGATAKLVAPVLSSGGDAKPKSADVAELEREIEKQADLEQALTETLGILDGQLEQLCEQISELDTEARLEETKSAQLHQQSNDLGFVLERCEAEQWALDEKYARLASQLTQLQRTNVYNDVFNISASEGIASINGFRLGGRSAPHNVEWAEINAAWGQALLLLQTVARRLELDFNGYRLIPMGSFSRIERAPDGGDGETVTLELFGSGDLYLGRLFQNRRFDAAMVAYLECLRQVAQRITALNPQLRVPYAIDHDKIGAASIKPQFGQDDVWTRACRNTLMNARWALAFASSYTP
ncbi:Vacuolar protein sorting-associated protein atg6 [Coemansia guatemalensis]|uniref:Vacuolar protein sorting-associated protein atg6 n=1 Tax=Coemansia guatemalensis TaxID=2761395 RepID=A0A9W8LTQ9_9FUNG|nr:Vacuolar protein sorting-associated protein atg6 [Coemansia guatemalensis]